MTQLAGWSSTRRSFAGGVVESEQRVTVGRPVVDRSERGARRLAGAYWAELRRFGRGVLAVREHPGGVDVRLVGRRVLALGPLETRLTDEATAAVHPILGGLLVRRQGGQISFEQLEGEPIVLRSRITGFSPRRGPFYRLVQWNLHLAVSRRYFRRLAGDPP
jgi:hypothetical protein